jgi:hypothetical protein
MNVAYRNQCEALGNLFRISEDKQSCIVTNMHIDFIKINCSHLLFHICTHENCTGTCRLLCHLAVVRGINYSVVGMRPLLLLQLVRLSSVAWWLFWGCHEHAFHRPGGEEAQTDKLLVFLDISMLYVEVLQLATILCG